MSRRVRVLWLTKGLGRGGAEQLLVSLAANVNRDRVDIETAYLLPWKNALVEELQESGVEVHCLPQRREYDLGWLNGLRRLAAERQYDVVHTHMPVSASFARLLFARTTTAVVHSEHNVWSRYRLPTRVLNAATYALNDHVVTVSQAVDRSVSRHYIPRLSALPPIEVVLHGIDLASIVPSNAATRAAARARLHLPDDASVVGTVGSLTSKKDQETLLKAAGLLRRVVPNLRVVIVGDGPLAERLRKSATDLGVADIVTFAGIRDDVTHILQAFDVFALSSLHEGLAISLVEALAAGVPAVATNVGGIPEVMGHEGEGLLVPAGSPVELSAAVVRLLSDSELHARCAETARRRAAAFDIRRAARRIEEIYEIAATRKLTR